MPASLLFNVMLSGAKHLSKCERLFSRGAGFRYERKTTALLNHRAPLLQSDMQTGSRLPDNVHDGVQIGLVVDVFHADQQCAEVQLNTRCARLAQIIETNCGVGPGS